jgi:hypothetical protein
VTIATNFSLEVAMLTFGKTPTYQSGSKPEVAVSDDKRALTLTFSDLKVTVGSGKSPAPVSTQLFSFVLPLEGDDKRAEIEFIVQGFVLTTGCATASMVCSVNGQTIVADFPGNSEQSLTQKLKFAAKTPSDCRLSVMLLVGRDSKNANAEAHLNVSAIDAEILPRVE